LGEVSAVGWRSAPALIVTDELVRAVRNESAAAVRWWWDLSVGVVRRYRKAFGVSRANNPSSHELIPGAAPGAPARCAAPARRGGVRSEAEADCRGRLRLVLPHGYHGPRWTEDQLALRGKAPDGEVARLTGRSAEAVRPMRTRRGIPAARENGAKAERPGKK
jgi:hypothetical protein